MATALIDHNLPAFLKDGTSSSLVLTGQAIAKLRDSTRSQIRTNNSTEAKQQKTTKTIVHECVKRVVGTR
jgi:hypothetical protein